MKTSRYFYIKLMLRILVGILFLILYFMNSSILDFSVSKPEPVMVLFWMGLMAELLSRFIPGKLHPIGMQKHLKKNFLPTANYEKASMLSEEDKAKIKKLNGGAIKVLIAYVVLNAIWFILYFLHIFRTQELFMIMIFYFVGDMVCANFFCPFRIFLMKNRCCNVCRIYNWDATMLIFPLLVVPCFYSYSLAAVAIAYTLYWEIVFHKHPERFVESCNENISCLHCEHGMCPHKRYQTFCKILKRRKRK